MESAWCEKCNQSVLANRPSQEEREIIFCLKRKHGFSAMLDLEELVEENLQPSV